VSICLSWVNKVGYLKLTKGFASKEIVVPFWWGKYWSVIQRFALLEFLMSKIIIH